MGSLGGNRDYRHIAAVRSLVFAHFRARGIPASKHDQLWFRWLSQKGMRPPA